MSKTWYPVIDYENCTECQACFNHCKHGVFELKDNLPAVVKPDNCVHECRGCQNKCPANAISYIGDTGQQGSGCGCDCDCDCC